MIEIGALECPLCGYIIYSRTRHDFRSCECGAVSVDGGLDYMKVSWDDTLVKWKDVRTHKLKLPLTTAELYEDWNTETDRYGKVAPCGPPSCSLPSSQSEVSDS